MLSLRNTASIEAALGSALDPALRTLLAQRMEQLSDYDVSDLSELAHFIVVQPGDALAAIEAELGFPILQNLVDGVRYGDPYFTPSWEWIMDHGGWYELTYVLSDDGFGVVVFVQDHPGVDPELLALCASEAGK